MELTEEIVKLEIVSTIGNKMVKNNISFDSFFYLKKKNKNTNLIIKSNN